MKLKINKKEALNLAIEKNIREIIESDYIPSVLLGQLMQVNIEGFHELPDTFQFLLDVEVNKNKFNSIKKAYSEITDNEKIEILKLIVLNSSYFIEINKSLKEVVEVDILEFKNYLLQAI